MNANISLEHRYRETRNVTILGVVVNIFLAITKIMVGLWGHSKALVVDGIHSLADLISDAIVLIAAKFANEDADAEHPYGHGRIETAATVGLGILLLLTGIGFALEAIKTFFMQNDPEAPHYLALWIAFIGILLKEALFQYTRYIAKKIESNMLAANAWHHRSDAFSSLIVLVGILGALIGFIYLDAIAAIIVAFMIAHIGWQQLWGSIKELIDTAPDKEQIKAIKKVIREVDGVKNLHQLRSRSMAGKTILDVHIQVSPYISVSEGHHIGDNIIFALQQRFHQIQDITIHIDPEQDSKDIKQVLPLRQEICDLLYNRWSHLPFYTKIENINLHYINNKIMIEVTFPFALSHQPGWKDIIKRYQYALQDIKWLKSVHFLFKMHHFGESKKFYKLSS